MKVTGHWVSTPRSNTITGSFLHAASTAGVSAAVVVGETMSRSQFPLSTKALMSEICLSSLAWASATVKDLMSFFSTSTCACMLVKPTTRHGFSRLALEKQIRYGPGFLYCDVSTILPPRCCSHGLPAGPSGVIASISLAAWNSFGSSKFWADAGLASPASAAAASIAATDAFTIIFFPPADHAAFTRRAFASPLSDAATAPCAERHRRDQNESLRGLLQRLRQAEQGQKREERGERQRAGDRADDGAAPAHELDPADNAGGDRLKLEPEPDVDRNPAEPAEHDPRRNRRQRRNDERPQPNGFNLDAGEASRAGVVANGEHPPAEDGSVQAPPDERRDGGEHEDRERKDFHDGHVVKHETAEHPEIVGQVAARCAAAPHHRGAIDREQRPERRDERRGLEVGDDRAVDQADDETDRVEDADRPPGLRGVVGRKHGSADDRDRHERSDREVEPAAHQHEDLPRGEDRQRRRAAQKIHRARGLEIARLQEPDRAIENDEHDHREIDLPGERGRGRGVLAVVENDGHATRSRDRTA